MARKDVSMTSPEIVAFLSEGRKTLEVSSNGPDGYPHTIPMWFVVDDGKVVFRSFSRSQKIVNLRRDPKLTVLVEEGRRYEKLQGVMMKGRAKLVDDPAYCLDLYVALANRYGFPGIEPPVTPEEDIRKAFAGHAAKQTVVVVDPVEVVSWDYRKLGAVTGTPGRRPQPCTLPTPPR